MYTSQQSVVICKHIPLLQRLCALTKVIWRDFLYLRFGLSTGCLFTLIWHFFPLRFSKAQNSRFATSVKSWREILGSLQPGDSQWTRKQRRHRGSVNCIWRRGGKCPRYHSFRQIDPISKHCSHTYPISKWHLHATLKVQCLQYIGSCLISLYPMTI